MSDDNNNDKKRKIQIAAGVLFVIILSVVLFLFFSEEEVPEAAQNLGPSDSMVPADPSSIGVDANGTLVATPSVVSLSPAVTSQILTIMASGVPIRIVDVRVPSEHSADLRVTSIDCPAPTQPLTAGSACSANVEWSGAKSLATTIEVIGTSGLDESKEIKTVIPVTAEGVSPELGAAVAGLDSQPAGVAPTQPVAGAPAGSPVGVMSQPVMDAGPSLAQQRQAAYIQARRAGQFAPVAGSNLTPTARSAYTSWNNIGAPGAVSSFPTDMSRVLTPDKAITAVIANPIDTRMAVTAVAMVDRDIYGNNGRTVVIPRGSKLIGSVGGGIGRIGIAWSQLIRPDGVRFMFEGQSGDAMGRGGVPGRVNERLLQRYGYSLLPSTVAAGLTAALGGQTTTSSGTTGTVESQDARSVAAQILTQPLNQIASDIYAENSKIVAQTVVPAGTRITVWSIGDLRLKPVGERDTQEKAEQNRSFSMQGSEVELPTANTGTRAASVTAPSRGSSEGQIAEGNYPVGRIDENGNYIAPGMDAPTPTQAPISRSSSTAARGQR
jgi:type IV secretory pathway VirB10-like protein